MFYLRLVHIPSYSEMSLFRVFSSRKIFPTYFRFFHLYLNLNLRKMSKKRHRNAFVDEQAEEDSAEESDAEKKQRVAAMKKLKSNRPSKFSQ